MQITLAVNVGYRYERDTGRLERLVGQQADVTGTAQVTFIADVASQQYGIALCAYDPSSLTVDYHQNIATGIFYRDKEAFIQMARDAFKSWIPRYALEQWSMARQQLQAQADQAGISVTIPDQPNLVACP